MRLFRRRKPKQECPKWLNKKTEPYADEIKKMLALSKMGHPIGFRVFIPYDLFKKHPLISPDYRIVLHKENGEIKEKIPVVELPLTYYYWTHLAGLVNSDDLGEVVLMRHQFYPLVPYPFDKNGKGAVISKTMAMRDDIWKNFEDITEDITTQKDDKDNSKTPMYMTFYDMLAHPTNKFFNRIMDALRRYNDNRRMTGKDFNGISLRPHTLEWLIFQKVDFKDTGKVYNPLEGFYSCLKREPKPEDIYVRIIFPSLKNFAKKNLPYKIDTMMSGINAGVLFSTDYSRDLYRFIRNKFEKEPDAIYEWVDLMSQFSKEEGSKYLITIEEEIDNMKEQVPGIFGTFGNLQLSNTISSFDDITLPVYKYVHKPFFSDPNFLSFLPNNFHQGISFSLNTKEKITDKMLFWISSISASGFLGVHAVLKMADLRSNETIMGQKDKIIKVMPDEQYKIKAVKYFKHLLDNMVEMQKDILSGKILHLSDYYVTATKKRDIELNEKFAEALFKATDELYNINKNAIEEGKKRVFTKDNPKAEETYKSFSLFRSIDVFSKYKDKTDSIYRDMQRSFMMYIMNPELLENYLNIHSSIIGISTQPFYKTANPFIKKQDKDLSMSI